GGRREKREGHRKAQLSVLEDAQAGRRRQSRDPLEPSPPARSEEIQGPRSEREREGDDRRARRAVADCRRRERHAGREKERQEMAKQQVRQLRKLEVAPRSRPEEQGEQPRRPGDQGEGREREQLDRQPQRDRGGRLQKELAGAVSLLFGDEPDRDEGIE